MVAAAVGVAGRHRSAGSRRAHDPAPAPAGSSRKAGGGRKRAEAHDPALVAALEQLVDPDSRGDPMSPLRWTQVHPDAGHGVARARSPGQRLVVRRLLSGRATACKPTPRPPRAPAPRPRRPVRLPQRPGRPTGAGRPGDQRGHQEEGTRRQLATVGGNGSPTASPSGSTSTTSSTPTSARRSPTASTTSPRTPAGSAWALTTTPPRSRWPPSRRWWTRSDQAPTRRAPTADHRRRRRVQRLPHPAVEDRTRRPGRRAPA